MTTTYADSIDYSTTGTGKRGILNAVYHIPISGRNRLGSELVHIEELYERLVDVARQRIRSGELTERGLSRL